MIRELHKLVRRAAKILSVRKSTSRRVIRRFVALMMQICRRVQRANSEHQMKAYQHMLRTALYFERGLFECYDEPVLPPTNNDHEGVFGSLRRHERKVTGHKSTARRTVRDGPHLLIVQHRLQSEAIGPAMLATVPQACWRARLQAQREHGRTQARPALLRRTLSDVLKEIKLCCRRLRKTRAPRGP